MALLLAFRAFPFSFRVLLYLRYFDRDDTRWNCNDGITDDHDYRGDHFAYGGLRRYVAITDCRKSYYSPVNADWNAGKSMFGPFYEIHDRPHDDHQCENGPQEDRNLVPAVMK